MKPSAGPRGRKEAAAAAEAEPAARVFVLMPFSPKFAELLKNIKLAGTRAGAVAERVDEQLYDEDILNRIVGQIEKADAIVAVMTGKSPNVFYEVGIAHALKKHVVLLTNNADDIPFDLKHCRHVVYKTPNTKLVKELAEELKWTLSNPRVTDSYYQEYKNALEQVQSAACGLAPYFTPIASRCFNQWVEFVRALVNSGVKTDGPERLEITRLIVHETKKYTLIERIIGDPETLHSGDWMTFYDEIGQDAEVEKQWILCVDPALASQRIQDVAATWKFLKDRNFSTRFCSPEQLERARRDQASQYDAIEDYGACMKLLRLPAASYASGENPNVLETIFKPVDRRDRRWIRTLTDCSKEIDEQWFERLRGAPPPVCPAAVKPAQAGS